MLLQPAGFSGLLQGIFDILPVGVWIATDGLARLVLGAPDSRTIVFTPALQADFNRAVALLHSFWFNASAAAFTGVAEKDPSCGIAWWGVAMSRWGNPFAPARPVAALEQGREAIAKARAAGAKTERERQYIEAAAALNSQPPSLKRILPQLEHQSPVRERVREVALERASTFEQATGQRVDVQWPSRPPSWRWPFPRSWERT